MFAREDDFPRPVIRRFDGVTIGDISDYLKGHLEVVIPSLPEVCWENVLFDATIGEDMLSPRRETARILYDKHVSPITCAIVPSLERVLYAPTQEDQRAQEQLKKTLRKDKARIALLYAHGAEAYGKWYYLESNMPVAPIQQWIDEPRQERPDLLLLHACNEAGFTPLSRGVPVLYAKGIVGFGREYTYHRIP